MPEAWAVYIVGAMLTVIIGLVVYIFHFARHADEKRHAETAALVLKLVEQLRILGQLEARMPQLEKFIQELRDWKHLKGDPYVNDMPNMNRRLDRLERFANGKLER